MTAIGFSYRRCEARERNASTIDKKQCETILSEERQMSKYACRIDYNICDRDAQLLNVVLARAIAILEGDDRRGSLDLEESRLLFELRCSYRLVGEISCLNTFVEIIGVNKFCDLLAATSALSWEDDSVLIAYLDCIFNHYNFERENRRDMGNAATKH